MKMPRRVRGIFFWKCQTLACALRSRQRLHVRRTLLHYSLDASPSPRSASSRRRLARSRRFEYQICRNVENFSFQVSPSLDYASMQLASRREMITV